MKGILYWVLEVNDSRTSSSQKKKKKSLNIDRIVLWTNIQNQNNVLKAALL